MSLYLTARSRRRRLTTNVQKRVEPIPMERMTPKPLIGPVPSQMRMTAVRRVVILASKMVVNALSKPAARALARFLPSLSSSRIRSKMRILESTAIPTVSTSAAMPGRVRVDLMEA